MTATRRLFAVWVGLVALTFASLTAGIEQRGDNATIATILVLGLAMIKIRLIGIHFMDLRSAPRLLRKIFDGYVCIVFATLAALALPW
jgi:Prokaryotic Cytochrome C oxidase subunit IV